MRNNDKKGRGDRAGKGRRTGGERQKPYFSPEERDSDKPKRRSDGDDRERRSPAKGPRTSREGGPRKTSRDEGRGFGRKREEFKGGEERTERKSVRRDDDRRGNERKGFEERGDKRRTSSGKEQGRKRSYGDEGSEEKSFRRSEGGKSAGYGERKGRTGSFDKKKPYGDDKRPSRKRDDDFSWDDDSKEDKKPSRKAGSKSTSGRKRSNDDEAGLIRLNKYIANAGICSRREADDLIKTGVVSVNGKIITEMGYKVRPEDVVRYNNETLKKERMMYVLLNKPKDYITTADDPSGRKTVLELVQGAGRERIYPVGRLDRATTGVLLLTNDGELTKRLTHPRYGVQKIYHVELDKNVKSSDLEKIKDGIELEDGTIKADDVAYVGDGQDKTQVGIELHSGRNRIVRRIFEHLGYNVRKLDRVMFAGLTKKDLPRGRWRHLTEKEVGMLYMISSKEK